MAVKDTLDRLSDEIINEYLILDPTSDSTKPPHMANGLFRMCTGETCDVKWATSEEILAMEADGEFIPLTVFPYLEKLFESE